jgi:hypothetical protein
MGAVRVLKSVISTPMASNAAVIAGYKGPIKINMPTRPNVRIADMCTAPMGLTCMRGSAPSVKEAHPGSGIGGFSGSDTVSVFERVFVDEHSRTIMTVIRVGVR